VWVTDSPFAQTGNPGTLQFSAMNYDIAENGGAGSANVARSGGSSGTVSVDYATTGGSATAGADYQAAGGTLSWADEESGVKSINVSVNDDSDIEGNETIQLSLSNVAGGATLGSRDVATMTIIDNDLPNAGAIRFSAANYSAGEDSNSFDISVVREGGGDGEASTQIAFADGTAVSGADYEVPTGALSWPDGEIGPQTLTITLIDDDDVEGNETVNLSFASVTGASIGTPSAAILTIIDDESVNPGSVRLSATDYSVGEGAASVTISVGRIDGEAGSVSVGYALTGGTATAGADFEQSSGTLSWADGESSDKSFEVVILDDSVDEPDETVSVSLENPAGGVQLADPLAATLTIVDDDTVSPPVSPSPSSGGGSTGLLFLFSLITIRGRQELRSARDKNSVADYV
jgi:hypothetical protein